MFRLKQHATTLLQGERDQLSPAPANHLGLPKYQAGSGWIRRLNHQKPLVPFDPNTLDHRDQPLATGMRHSSVPLQKSAANRSHF